MPQKECTLQVGTKPASLDWQTALDIHITQKVCYKGRQMETTILFLLILFFVILNLALGTFIYKRHKNQFRSQDNEIEKLKKNLEDIPEETDELTTRLEELNKEISTWQKKKPSLKKKKQPKNYEEAKNLQEILLKNEQLSQQQLDKVQRFQKLNGINFENALSILGIISKEELENAKSEVENP